MRPELSLALAGVLLAVAPSVPLRPLGGGALASEATRASAASGPKEPGAGTAALPASGPAARRVVESFQAVLLDGMKRSDALGFEGRYQLIAEKMDETFDLPAIAHAAIFRGWKRLGPEDRSRWVDLSRRYWASRYAHEYGSFSGEHFETLGVDPADEGVLVRTRMTRPGGDAVALDYQLWRVGDAYRIVDFYVGGPPSQVRQLREFDYAVLERGGFEGLVMELGRKIDQFGRD